MTPEQEKALHDALDRLAGELATLKIMLRRLRAEGRIFARWPHEPIDHGKRTMRCHSFAALRIAQNAETVVSLTTLPLRKSQVSDLPRLLRR